MLILLAATSLTSGCNTMNRLSEVGRAPKMTTIQNHTHTLPMPSPSLHRHRANSLWRSGARAFFKDQRAAVVGDILTVEIAIDDKAELSNSSTRNRVNTEDSAVTALFGYEASLTRVLPEACQPRNLIDLDSETANSAKGTIDRDEEIDLKIAAVVTQTLPQRKSCDPWPPGSSRQLRSPRIADCRYHPAGGHHILQHHYL